MKRLLTILPIVVFPAFAFCQTGAAREPQQVIELLFEALSEGSMTKMEQAVTPDMTILEHGVVWTLDTVRNYLSRKRPADFKRINSFEFFQTEITDKMAFVSYHNRADIHSNNKDRTVKWLESAVLVKEND